MTQPLAPSPPQLRMLQELELRKRVEKKLKAAQEFGKASVAKVEARGHNLAKTAEAQPLVVQLAFR